MNRSPFPLLPFLLAGPIPLHTRLLALVHGFTYAANICRLAMGIVPFISQFHEHEAACSLVNKCFIFYVFQVILLRSLLT